MSIAVEDWDELSVARRRREDAAAAARAEDAPASQAPPPAAGEDEDDEDDDLEDTGENLRPVLSIAGGNIAVWLLAHVSGVVELVGVSFATSVGLLLAAYVLREWHRDRSALVCLVGALPLPVTIFGLL